MRARALALFVALIIGGAVGEPPLAVAACWLPPVPAPIVEPFVEPECPWCPGHRGVEFGPTAGAVVRAIAGGRVAFAGTVVGERYVAIEQHDGLRVTYGRLASIDVAEGDTVTAGTVVGTAGDRLMLTVRRDGAYIDPAPMLGRLVRRPWLVPTGGSPPRAAPPPRLECGG